MSVCIKDPCVLSAGTEVFYISHFNAAYLNHFLANPLVPHERGRMVDKPLHMFAFVHYFIYVKSFNILM